MKIAIDENKLDILLLEKMTKYYAEAKKRFDSLNKETIIEDLLTKETAKKIEGYRKDKVKEEDWEEDVKKEVAKGMVILDGLVHNANFELFDVEELVDIFTFTKEEILKTAFNKEDYGKERESI